MGATYSNKDPLIYFPFKLTPIKESQLLLQFEMNCEMDIHEILTEKEQKKHLKRFCAYKLLLTPLEVPLTWIFFSKTEFQYKLKMTALYWQHFRNKISMEKFGKEVNKLLQTGKLV